MVKAKENSSVLLHRSGYTLFLVATYSSLALVAWTLTCLLTYNPLTVGQYELNVHERSYGSSAKFFHAKYVKSEEIYRAARTLQTIVALLTIPLTSAVCSAAAPAFAQTGPRQHRLTMRQLMVLADKGWTDPVTIAKVLCGNGKKLGSRLLFFAVLLNILVIFLADIPDQFEDSWDNNVVTIMTRNALSTSNTAPQARLWQNEFNCSMLVSNLTEQCLLGAATLGQISQMSNPYFAQLPAGTHTGVIKQFLPRMNSSVRWESVPAEAMPANCASLPGSFYVHYSNSTWPPESDWDLMGGAPKNWSIEACMPGNQSAVPWKSTYHRQDFVEELYLNISVMGYDWQHASEQPPGSPHFGGVFKVTSNTTAGYFELPNHMNGGKAGEIIEDDPKNLCGSDCMSQTPAGKLSSRSAAINYQNDDSWDLNTLKNKGPLLTVAMALFGYGSYTPAQLDHPKAYLSNITYYNDSPKNKTNHASSCINQRPFESLLQPSYGRSAKCVMDDVRSLEELDDGIARYLQSFYVNTQYEVGDAERPTNAFAAAVYLATEAWFTTGHSDWGSRSVHSDPGADTTIPTMSLASMIILSLMLGVYLACIIVLSVYISRKPLWTRQLDSFTMMRIGAEMHEQVPFKICFEVSAVRILDDMPGYVGDATGGEGDVGMLGIGSNTPLTGVRWYESYKPDAVKEAQETRRRAQFQIHPLSQQQDKSVNARQ
ncbi:hypothetical protein CB0940_09144 [Cercospora beticola]|uniref:Uncharacterized protein n=1 Tax=Cercospora beticola TaxID=122368 RepID=A0A2G5HII6_CERBT|nr:hypothetical protein CB0940_09144 [Cercospora beticola]PIA92339.1 hypothetical protein CB0940_09144 [Cercospora beticola]WPB06567.1 hypothetical protein RHO25_011224 [Cercospora beticola]